MNKTCVMGYVDPGSIDMDKFTTNEEPTAALQSVSEIQESSVKHEKKPKVLS